MKRNNINNKWYVDVYFKCILIIKILQEGLYTSKPTVYYNNAVNHLFCHLFSTSVFSFVVHLFWMLSKCSLYLHHLLIYSLSPSLSLLSETTVAVEKRRNIETLCMNRASFLQETQTVFLASKVQNNLGPSGPPSVQLWLTHMHSHLHGVIQACLSISRKTLAFSSQWTKASVCTLVQWMLTLANAFVLALENSCSSMCVAKSER